MKSPNFGKIAIHRIFFLLPVLLLSLVVSLPVAAQSSGGLGVGQGHGREIGINLPIFEAIRADAANGLYDRPCTEAEHNPYEWHLLVNVQAKCHYDHQHGDDPNYVNDIFGVPGAWFDSPGQSVSYPWQTFPAADRTESYEAYEAEGRMENQAKHEGYMWVVRRDQECGGGSACVTDLRVQFHGIMGAAGAVTRWHSYSAEVRVCQNPSDPATCGIGRHGGWIDFGVLFVTDSGNCSHSAVEQFISLPVDNQYMPQDRPDSRDQIRCHQLLNMEDLPNYPSRSSLAEWWAHQGGRVRFQIRSFDPISQINAQDPSAWDFYCEVNDTSCHYNQSINSIFFGYVYPVPQFVDHCKLGCISIDPDNDGRTNYTGYTNRWGALVNTCSTAGLDCVPVEYNNITKNFFNNQEARYLHTPCNNCTRVDYDISPQGQTWITWFFRKYAGVVPTPPITQPEAPEGPALYFEVEENDGNQLNVNLQLINVSNVFGVEAQCSVNPQVLQGTGFTAGDFNNNNSFVLDEGYQADGSWHFAASRLAPNPAINGDATAFSLSYTTLADGDGMLDCSAVAVDGDGVPLSLDVVNGSAIVMTPIPQQPPEEEEMPNIITGLIAGTAGYQNRSSNAGISVKLLGLNSTVLIEEITDGAGAFSFSDVAIGDYDLQFSAPQHIPVLETVVVNDATGVQQLQIQLRAGDVDDNGAITIDDILLVAANFGLNTVPEISNVDLNADGLINISDLSLTAGNLDLVSPLNSQ